MKTLTILCVLLLAIGLFAQTIQDVSIVPPQSNTFEVTWDVTPSASNMDGVVALASVDATTWGELSAIVRCKPDGQFDARNGGEYTADAELNYEGGATYSVRLTVDVFAQKYSVFITPPGEAEVTLATDYAFRVPADVLMYRCIFVNDDAVAGATLDVQNFNYTVLNDRMPCPIGAEEIRGDAQCDTALVWEEMGLFDTCPILHEYTAYKGSITVDGDPSDEDWQKIPWTPFNVYHALKVDDVDRTFMAWEEFDEYWESWMDYSGWFKVLWNPDEGVMYYLFKEYDDMIVWSGDAFTDSYAEDVQDVKQWQGDTYEIEIEPYIEEPHENMKHIGNVFVVDGEVRFKPLSLTSPDEALQLADGDATTSWPDTDGKSIAFTRNEETGESLYELAIVLQPGMEEGVVSYFGLCRTEGDYEYDDGKNRECNFYWGAGKRNTPQWGSLLFSAENPPATAVSEKVTAQPSEFQLGANYPNPFNPSTTIPFSLSKTENVTIDIYNTLGQRITTLVDETRNAGLYTVNWNGTNDLGVRVPSGLYFIKMTTENATFVEKALLVQ